MGESHEHGENHMRIWGSQWSQYSLFRRLLLLLVLLFVCSPILASFCPLVPRFTAFMYAIFNSESTS
jgi:predicted ABC-type exoprotein transport system permease subunit